MVRLFTAAKLSQSTDLSRLHPRIPCICLDERYIPIFVQRYGCSDDLNKMTNLHSCHCLGSGGGSRVVLSSSLQWQGVEPPTNFQNGRASQDLNFQRRVAGKEGSDFFQGWGRGCNFQAAITKKTKNSNWEIVPKNLVTFER